VRAEEEEEEEYWIFPVYYSELLHASWTRNISC